MNQIEKSSSLLEMAQRIRSGVVDLDKSIGFKEKVHNAMEGVKSVGNEARSIGDSALGSPPRAKLGPRALVKRDRVALGTGAVVGAAGAPIMGSGNNDKNLEKTSSILSKAVHFGDSITRRNLSSAKKTVEGVREIIEHQARHPEKYKAALTENHRFLAVAKRKLEQVEHQTKKDTLKAGLGLGVAGAGVFGGAKGYQSYENRRDQEAYENFYKNAGFIDALSSAAGKGNFLRKSLNSINAARGGKVKTFWEGTMGLDSLKGRQAEANILSKLPKKEQLERLKTRFPDSPELGEKLKSLHEQQTAARVAVAGVGAGVGYAGYKGHQLIRRMSTPAQPQPQYYYQ